MMLYKASKLELKKNYETLKSNSQIFFTYRTCSIVIKEKIMGHLQPT